MASRYFWFFVFPTLYFLEQTIEINERRDLDDFPMIFKTRKHFQDI